MRKVLVFLSFALLCSCTNSSRKSSSLVAYWSFDDAIPANVTDGAWKGLSALNKGAGQVDGYKGKALEFDGKSVLEVMYDPLIDSFSKGMTLTAWIRKDTSSAWNTIISREIDSTWSEYMGLAVFKDHALFSVDPDGGKYINVTDSAYVLPDKWVHVAGTYDNENFKLYVNGSLIKTGSCMGPLKFRDKNPLFIGGNSNDKNHSVLDCFKGSIDEVRIYNKALSEQEIKTILNL